MFRNAYKIFLFAALLAGAPLGALAQTELASAVTPAFSAPPLMEGRVSDGFGMRADPFSGREAFHGGVDILADEGVAVAAPSAGRVTFSGRRSGYGLVIEIDHGGGFVTRYAHLSALNFERDAQVAAGDIIARVGNTGRSTVPHLHMEVWRDGRAVDPAEYISLPDPR